MPLLSLKIRDRSNSYTNLKPKPGDGCEEVALWATSSQPSALGFIQMGIILKPVLIPI
jgi:hypothetical protein